MAQDIVGRDAELAALETLLASARGEPAAALIEGEAGIGKTSVWEEGVRRAKERSYRVLRCRPAEAETELAYAALGDLLSAVADEELGELVDVQREALEVALLRIRGKRAADPRAIYSGLVSLLTGLAEEAPLLVAIDDLQWLDAASARALEFAFRRLPGSVALILAQRTGDDERKPLALERSLPAERLERVVLGPLSLAALDKVLKGALGGSFARPTLVRLRELSGGNPFFAIEIGRELKRRGSEPAVGERLPVPETLQELLAARIDSLSPAAREVLLAASALSRPSVGPIEEALDKTEVGPALVEAEEAGLVTAEGGRIRFTHPLLASTVYASAAGERRRRLHGRLAEVAAEEEERARHLALSVTAPDEDAAGVLERAAQSADSRGAQDAAAELFERARRLTPGERDQELARRTLGEASALFLADDLDRARELAQEAVEMAAPGRLRAEGLLLLGRIAHFQGTSDVATEQLERALAEVGDDRAMRGRIHGELAWMYVVLDQARGVGHAEAAIELLDEEEEPGLLAFILFTKFLTDAHLGRGADRALLERGLELEARALERFEATSNFPLVWFTFMDEFDAARARWRAQAEWARARGEEVGAAERLSLLALVELHAGNWELAERYIEESCATLMEVGAGGALAVPLGLRVMIGAHRGQIERARAALAAMLDQPLGPGNLWWEALGLSIRGFVELSAGDLAAADEALTRMTEQLEQLGVVDALPQRGEPDHIEALVALGELDRAQVVLARLEERGKRLPRLWISTTLPRCRALVLAADGDVPAALAAVEEAAEHPKAGELPFELARTLLVKGQLQRRAKQKRAAKESLTRALEIFERLGAPNWAERTRAELDRVGLRSADPDELTNTEVRIAELAATGMTNREVAEAAFVSPKTVEANLSRAYRKLGIRSRAELGARMAERGEAGKT